MSLNVACDYTRHMDASTNGPIINITGERVALGPIREDLLPFYERWENDFEVIRTHIQTPLPMTAEIMRRWFERVRTGAKRIPFTIYERETLQPIGLSGLMGVDFRNRTAEFNITIAEANFRGRGYGTETAQLVLDYAFTALGLHSVFLTTVDYNHAGLRVYEKSDSARSVAAARRFWRAASSATSSTWTS